MKPNKENVIVIGGGPAGLSAALYLARAKLKPLVFAGSIPGGQLMLTTEVENFPGIKSILGPDLISEMRKQVLSFDGQIIDEDITQVDFKKNPFFLVSSSGKSLLTKSILIATGASAKWLDLPSEERLRGKGVSACATCDGFFFREKIVAVIGGGDTAMEEALTLTKFAKKVYIIHRRNHFRASKIMQDRVFNNKKIEIVWNAQVEEILGENRVEGVKIKIIDENKSLQSKSIKLDGVFVAIGHQPNTKIFENQIILDEKGYIITAVTYAFKKLTHPQTNFQFPISNFQFMTSVSGVFAAGDVIDPHFRQASTAAGMGVAAALEIERYLME